MKKYFYYISNFITRKECVFLTLSVFLCAAAYSITTFVMKYDEHAESAIAGTVSVKGVGEVRVNPTVAQFTFTVDKLGKNIAAVRAEVSGKQAGLLAYVKSQGVEENCIKTLSFSVTPEYSYTPIHGSYNSKAVLVGYRVSQVTQIDVRDFAKAENILTYIAGNGATSISQLRFTLSEDDQKKFDAEATAQAIAHARTEAQKQAEQLGVRFGDIQSFYITDGHQPVLAYAAMNDSALRKAAPVTLHAGESVVRKEVTITYKIK